MASSLENIHIQDRIRLPRQLDDCGSGGGRILLTSDYVRPGTWTPCHPRDRPPACPSLNGERRSSAPSRPGPQPAAAAQGTACPLSRRSTARRRGRVQGRPARSAVAIRRGDEDAYEKRRRRRWARFRSVSGAEEQMGAVQIVLVAGRACCSTPLINNKLKT